MKTQKQPERQARFEIRDQATGRTQCRELPLCAGSGEGCQWQALPSPVQCEETATRTQDQVSAKEFERQRILFFQWPRSAEEELRESSSKYGGKHSYMVPRGRTVSGKRNGERTCIGESTCIGERTSRVAVMSSCSSC
ncbi:uncharacterized protein [Miscanthus floridulus]|uniref:uncharacterized protein n=1 Tax=Miscanthus floridulus TaxID=154761 RepID=UPI00345AB9C6